MVAREWSWQSQAFILWWCHFLSYCQVVISLITTFIEISFYHQQRLFFLFILVLDFGAILWNWASTPSEMCSKRSVVFHLLNTAIWGLLSFSRGYSEDYLPSIGDWFSIKLISHSLLTQTPPPPKVYDHEHRTFLWPMQTCTQSVVVTESTCIAMNDPPKQSKVSSGS